jgi:inhibitor of the pro-sigma K processing machinery
MKAILKLVYNALIGAVVLLAINFIGGFFNFHIALNAVTALITGILGAPGVVLLILLKYMFGA